ncbi:MAG: glycosyltransferase family 2 protein, partial [Ktedonobacteraceae bacterium]
MPKKCLVYLLLFLGTGALLLLTALYPRPNLGIASYYIGIALILNLLTSVSTMKCLALLIIAPWHRLFTLKQQQKYVALPGSWPLISVLIPAWNEEVGLISTVKTVLNTSYPNVEIVVVNDGSTDHSDWVMRQFCAKYGRIIDARPLIPIIYHYQPNGGKGSALNTAIGLSHGSILVSIDADCVMDQGCLSALALAFL